MGRTFSWQVLLTSGHLYGEAGLRELVFEYDVFAVGSVQQNVYVKELDRA